MAPLQGSLYFLTQKLTFTAAMIDSLKKITLLLTFVVFKKHLDSVIIIVCDRAHMNEKNSSTAQICLSVLTAVGGPAEIFTLLGFTD